MNSEQEVPEPEEYTQERASYEAEIARLREALEMIIKVNSFDYNYDEMLTEIYHIANEALKK